MNFYEMVLLFFALCICAIVVRVMKGPTIWDRLMGFNMISMKIVLSIVLLAFILDQTLYLDIALAYAILGFIGTILIARYVEQEDDVS